MSRSEALASLARRSGLLALARVIPSRTQLLVVNYHRIGDVATSTFDDGVYSATPHDFERQIAWLARRYEPLGLDDVIDRLRRPRLVDRPSLLVTFDDGYRDNATVAAQILMRLGVPAAFFLPSAMLDAPALPWWDHVAYVVKCTRKNVLRLEPPFPATLELGAAPRREATVALCDVLKQAPADAVDEMLGNLEDRTEVNVDRAALGCDLFMSWDDARALLAAGFAIGSHTATHRVLSRLPAEAQRHELAASRTRLERALGRPVRALAYPVGMRDAFTHETKRLARETGYEAAFSFYGGTNLPAPVDAWDLRRWGVQHDLDFDLFRLRMLRRSWVASAA